MRVTPDLTPLRSGGGGFRVIYTARTITSFGSQASEVALLVQAKQLTGSPFAVGLIGLAELVPVIAFGLYGGVLADRFDRRAMIRWCQAALGACSALLLVNALLPHPATWPLYLLAAAVAAAVSLQRPSLDASIPRLVPRDQLTAASALLAMSQNASVIVGSSLGGVLAISPGPALVYALDLAGSAGAFCILAKLSPLPMGSGARADGVIGGLRYAIGRRDLLGSYLADLAAMTFGYPNAVLPFMAAVLHAPWSAGLMFAAPSVGGLGVTLISGWMSRVRRHGLAIALAAAGWGVAIAGFGLAPDVPVALACLAAAGGADMVSGIFRDVLWNQTIPDELRGRLAGVELLSYSVGPSAGQLRSGLVANLTSVRFSLVSGGVACVGLVAAVCAALPAFALGVKAEPQPVEEA